MQLQEHPKEATIPTQFSCKREAKTELLLQDLYSYQWPREEQRERIPIYTLVEQAYEFSSKKIKGTIVSDRRIHGGAPCFRGTRIPVYMVIEMYAQGMNTPEVRRQYPKLSSEMIKDALIFCCYLLGR